jgi:hypothetical protein
MFLSCSASSSDTAAPLSQCLPATETQAFYHRRNIPAFANWMPGVQRALQTADALIVMCSDESSQSVSCQQEIGLALGEGLLLLTVSTGGRIDH